MCNMYKTWNVSNKNRRKMCVCMCVCVRQKAHGREMMEFQYHDIDSSANEYQTKPINHIVEMIFDEHISSILLWIICNLLVFVHKNCLSF